MPSPSNTITELFIKYAQEIQPFREICDAARDANGAQSAIGTLESLPQTETCKPTFAVKMLAELSCGQTGGWRFSVCSQSLLAR